MQLSKKKQITTLLACVALALSNACSVASDDSANGAQSALPNDDFLAESTTLVEISPANGAKYTFLQVETGDVLVTVESDVVLEDSELPNSDKTLSELYEYISGESAPDALVQAELDALALRDQEPESGVVPADEASASELSSSAEGDISTITQDLTSGQFQSLYCPGGWDFLFCYPSTGGNPYVQLYSYYLAGAMSATNCTTSFQYRYYYNGAWRILVNRQASPGAHYWYYSYGGTRSRRWEILNNSGCGVRFSVWGNY